MALPEAGEVGGDLDGTAVRAEQVQHDGDPASPDGGAFRGAEEVLERRLDPRGPPRGVLDAWRPRRVERDPLGREPLDGGAGGRGEAVAQRVHEARGADLLERRPPRAEPGERLAHVRVVEGNRERVQVFQGAVIRIKGSGVRETFTVRKVSFGVGVERTFPVHSPIIAKIEVVTRGDVRRAKLYYLRDRVGKAAKIKEKRV